MKTYTEWKRLGKQKTKRGVRRDAFPTYLRVGQIDENSPGQSSEHGLVEIERSVGGSNYYHPVPAGAKPVPFLQNPTTRGSRKRERRGGGRENEIEAEIESENDNAIEIESENENAIEIDRPTTRLQTQRESQR